jgi:hypothetical protein
LIAIIPIVLIINLVSHIYNRRPVSSRKPLLLDSAWFASYTPQTDDHGYQSGGDGKDADFNDPAGDR